MTQVGLESWQHGKNWESQKYASGTYLKGQGLLALVLDARRKAGTEDFVMLAAMRKSVIQIAY